jgi:hypothetical protein
LIERNTEALLGPVPDDRNVRIMGASVPHPHGSGRSEASHRRVRWAASGGRDKEETSGRRGINLESMSFRFDKAERNWGDL